MRIIAGKFGGRTLKSPDKNSTHPMSERVRASLFNILGEKISGAKVLDAFAGTGSLGLEALSRGAECATLIEKDRKAQEIIASNIELLGVEDSSKLIKTGVSNWHATTPETTKYDIIFADPPYHDMQLSTVSKLVKHLQPSGLVVLSHPGRGLVPSVQGVVVVDNRSYGDAALAFYHLEEQA